MTTRSRSAARTARARVRASARLNGSRWTHDDIVSDHQHPQKGTIKVIKDLEPDGDPGRFNPADRRHHRRMDGRDSGTTGPRHRQHPPKVGERPARPRHDDYERRLDGANDQGSTSGEGPLNVTVDANEDIVCTITNTRETGTIEVIKDLEPNGDPGRFNLLIDGTTEEGNAGDGGTHHRRAPSTPAPTGSARRPAPGPRSMTTRSRSAARTTGRGRPRARAR